MYRKYDLSTGNKNNVATESAHLGPQLPPAACIAWGYTICLLAVSSTSSPFYIHTSYNHSSSDTEHLLHSSAYLNLNLTSETGLILNSRHGTLFLSWLFLMASCWWLIVCCSKSILETSPAQEIKKKKMCCEWFFKHWREQRHQNKLSGTQLWYTYCASG